VVACWFPSPPLDRHWTEWLQVTLIRPVWGLQSVHLAKGFLRESDLACLTTKFFKGGMDLFPCAELACMLDCWFPTLPLDRDARQRGLTPPIPGQPGSFQISLCSQRFCQRGSDSAHSSKRFLCEFALVHWVGLCGSPQDWNWLVHLFGLLAGLYGFKGDAMLVVGYCPVAQTRLLALLHANVLHAGYRKQLRSR
jgi:hypothetical protein